MLRPPAPRSFGANTSHDHDEMGHLNHPTNNRMNGHSHSHGVPNKMVYPNSPSNAIDLSTPLDSLNSPPLGPIPTFPQSSLKKSRQGPSAVTFDDQIQLPSANLEREGNNHHEFLAPGLFDKPSGSSVSSLSGNNVDYSEMQQALLSQEESRLRGTMVKEEEINNEHNLSDIFFHTVFGNVEGVTRAVEEFGADVNAIDDTGFAPLHYACRRPAIDIVKYLIDSGAQVHCVSKNKKADTPLCAAAQGGDLEVINLLLQKGANVNYVNGLQLNPLHLAIKEGKKLAAVFLIHNNADIELQDSEGHTALHWAAYRGEYRVLDILLKSGGNILAADNNGMLPIHWGAVHGHLDCLQRLYDEEPSTIQVKTKQDLTPIEMAKKYKQPEAENLLSQFKSASSNNSKHYSIGNLISDITAADSRPFFIQCGLVILLLTIIAYIDRPYNIIGMIIWGISNYFFIISRKETNTSMMGIGLWSHLFSILFYFTKLFPRTYYLWYFHILFLLINIIMYDWYRTLAFRDPGYIEPNRNDMVRMVEDMKTGQSIDRYCPTCWIRKPYRSKHCKQCDRCVLKMDHHCPFTGNCVGAGNLYLFYSAHTLYVLAEIGWMWLMYEYGIAMGFGTPESSYYEMYMLLMENEPILWALSMWHGFHMCWMIPLWFQQTYQVCTNITTNEIWNSKRYDYLQDPNTGVFYNPYNNGIIENFKELFYVSPREMYQKTINFPTQQAPIDQLSYLPTSINTSRKAE